MIKRGLHLSLSLDGQVAFVTGGGRGLGQALAKELARNGAAVGIVARSEDQIRLTARLIEQEGGRALAIVADVSDAGAVGDAVDQTESRFGSVDLLVNNAATTMPLGPVWETQPDDWRRAFDVNVIGTMICCRAVLPGMLERQRGRILNIVSVNAGRAGPAMVAYSATKAAIVRLTEGLAQETSRLGVTSIAFDPGEIETDMLREVVENEHVRRFYGMGMRAQRLRPSPERAVAFCLRLAVGEADAFCGRFLNVADDLDDLLARQGEILQRDLLSMRRLNG